jgi:hypothetical protein
MDPLAVTIGALALTENVAKLLKMYGSDIQSWEKVLDDIFGELLILQSILLETKEMIDELITQPPSLFIALQRCSEQQIRIAELMDYAGLEGKRLGRSKLNFRLLKVEDKLRKHTAAFKSAILLFRDIATK